MAAGASSSNSSRRCCRRCCRCLARRQRQQRRRQQRRQWQRRRQRRRWRQRRRQRRQLQRRRQQLLTFLRACWNMSRTRLAPTPTNISMNSVPAAGGKAGRSTRLVHVLCCAGRRRGCAARAGAERVTTARDTASCHPPMEKKGTPASPAIALASSVLPVPVGQRGRGGSGRHGDHDRRGVRAFRTLPRAARELKLCPSPNLGQPAGGPTSCETERVSASPPTTHPACPSSHARCKLTGGTDQQHAGGGARAKRQELGGVAQEGNNLHDFGLDLPGR